MLHGHEDSIEDDTDGDAQVYKRVHNDGIEVSLEPSPTVTTAPLQEDVSKGIPTWRTQPLVIFIF